MLTLITGMFTGLYLHYSKKWEKESEIREQEKWDRYEEMRDEMGITTNITRIRKPRKPPRNKHRH